MHITGDRIRLRAIERADLEIIRQWYNDPILAAGLGDIKWPTSEAQQIHHYERTMANEETVRMVVESLDKQCIGLTGFWHIHWRDRRAEHAVVIGDTDCRGQGFGQEVIRTCARYAFDQMDLIRLDAQILETNTRSLKVYQACGFKVEGTLRDHALRDGKRINRMQLGLLRDELI